MSIWVLASILTFLAEKWHSWDPVRAMPEKGGVVCRVDVQPTEPIKHPGKEEG